MPRNPGAHLSAHGTHKAAVLAPDRVQAALAEFKRLNTREARAAFADYWIGIWAQDFDYAWPMLYELLRIVEEDELYADPQRVGPGAPGDASAHGDTQSYPTFADYFTDRVGRRFEHWAELERAYRYAQTYAPGLFDSALSDALSAAERAEKAAADAAAAKERARALADVIDLPELGVVGNGRSRIDNINSTGGTSDSYLRRRLKRDRPDLFERVQRRESSARAAAIEAGITKPIISVRTDDAESAARTLRTHMPPQIRRALAHLLLDD
jgi:hypothetical protein